MEKVKILALNQYYLPGYKSGGPIRTIANMVDMLSDDFDFYIFTSDRDASDSGPYTSISVNTWVKVGRAHVFYADKKVKSMSGIRKIIQETPHDILYLNSFFNPVFTIIPLMLRRFALIPKKPLVLAPRGEFSSNALALKRWKKRLFILVGKLMGEYRKFIWQASSKYEKEDIQMRFMPSLNIFIAPDLPSKFIKTQYIEKKDSSFSILFLSRISPMKNVEFMLKSLMYVQEHVQVSIYGPIRDEDYWRSCQKLFQDLPENIDVSYCGSVPHDKVQDVMSAHDLFFLPTLGENYGHVISEALLAGLPVLIADTTPWRNLEADGLGWDLPLSDPRLFAEKIDCCARMPREERQRWREHVQRTAQDKMFDSDVIKSNRELFYKALASR